MVVARIHVLRVALLVIAIAGLITSRFFIPRNVGFSIKLGEGVRYFSLNVLTTWVLLLIVFFLAIKVLRLR
jgi:hypothetical protein